MTNDSATQEIIVIWHINPSIIRLVVNQVLKVALVTDSAMAAGLDDGEYFLENRRCMLKASGR